jgi:hypothetical protein
MTSTDNTSSIKRVRIFNDQRAAYNIKVTDAETGALIENVSRISFDVRTKDPMRAVLYIASPIVDIIADADIRHICPCCGKEKDRD